MIIKTKKERKRQTQFDQMVVDILTPYGLRPNERWKQMYEYEMDTPAGLLNVNPQGDWVANRFEDVIMGRAFSQGTNPYTGKWNFHYFNWDNLETVRSDLIFWYRCLMAWDPKQTPEQIQADFTVWLESQTNQPPKPGTSEWRRWFDRWVRVELKSHT